MKLQPEILRFAFLMQKVAPERQSGTLTLSEIYNQLGELIDFELNCPVGNPRLFAEAAARLAASCLDMVDHVNQLPMVRHGLIEAMNAHI